MRFDDQLKIESMKNPGQYLHCSGSNRTLGVAKFNVFTDRYANILIKHLLIIIAYNIVVN